jgi:hypothetical protein
MGDGLRRGGSEGFGDGVACGKSIGVVVEVCAVLDKIVMPFFLTGSLLFALVGVMDS